MAAPSHVPSQSIDDTRVYTSPDHVPAGWDTDRPGDLAIQPSGAGLGNQGPDQGYALRLTKHFDDRLVLAEGEHRDDAHAACVQVALKRASLFGRAPVIHDLEVAYRIWGLLDDEADPHLSAVRAGNFEGAAERHHYADVLRIVAAVPDDVLRKTPAEVEALCRSDWRACIDLDVLAGGGH